MAVAVESGRRVVYAQAAVDAVADLDSRRGLEGFFRAASERSAGARVWLPAATR